jgi:DNA gyrase subunit A
MGRATQGVKLINLKGKDSIAAVAKVMREDDDEVETDENLEALEGSGAEIAHSEEE